MSRYEYSVIPTPRKPRRAKGMKTNAARFAHMLTEEINAQAEDGWEYVRSETLPMDERPGMFKKAVETYQTVMVFRRPVAASETEVAETAMTATRDAPEKPKNAAPLTADLVDDAAPAVAAPIAAVSAAAQDAKLPKTEKPGYWD